MPDVIGVEPDQGKFEKDETDGKSMKARKEKKAGEVVLHLLGKE